MKLHAHPVHATPLPVVRPTWYRIAEALAGVLCIAVIGYAVLFWLPA